MLNVSIDLSNPCNLNCPYCYIEEKSSSRKIRRSDEIPIELTLSAISKFADAGARTVNIVGAGEPTVDVDFERVVRRIGRGGNDSCRVHQRDPNRGRPKIGGNPVGNRSDSRSKVQFV